MRRKMVRDENKVVLCRIGDLRQCFAGDLRSACPQMRTVVMQLYVVSADAHQKAVPQLIARVSKDHEGSP